MNAVQPQPGGVESLVWPAVVALVTADPQPPCAPPCAARVPCAGADDPPDDPHDLRTLQTCMLQMLQRLSVDKRHVHEGMTAAARCLLHQSTDLQNLRKYVLEMDAQAGTQAVAAQAAAQAVASLESRMDRTERAVARGEMGWEPAGP